MKMSYNNGKILLNGVAVVFQMAVLFNSFTLLK